MDFHKYGQHSVPSVTFNIENDGKYVLPHIYEFICPSKKKNTNWTKEK